MTNFPEGVDSARHNPPSVRAESGQSGAPGDPAMLRFAETLRAIARDLRTFGSERNLQYANMLETIAEAAADSARPRLSGADRAFLDAAMLAALPVAMKWAVNAHDALLKARAIDPTELAAEIAFEMAHALLRARNGGRGA